MSRWNGLAEQLQERRRHGLFRERHCVQSPQGPKVVVDGKSYLAFCSNDYLGLAGDPRVADSCRKAIDQYGVGGAASHLVIGHHEAHHRLEIELAEFCGRERALLFSTGYMANLGVVSALMNRGDVVIEDKLNHASLIDAGILSGAVFSRFKHADVEHLENRLSASVNNCAGKTLVITDGVFSMDGDLAPLQEITNICRKYDAWLMVDDAHGFGVLGAEGRGSLTHLGIKQDEAPIVVGTLGKAFGTAGAFVAGSDELIETLIQYARTYIYTTAMPPALAEATRTSLKIALEDEWRRDRLSELTAIFREEVASMGYQLMPSHTPIQPILLGESRKALEVSEFLKQQGILVTAIRPPTVPADTARLRVTFSASHSIADVQMLISALDRARSVLDISL